MSELDEKKKTAMLVLERWKSSLSKKDRSIKSVPANFDELFEELRKDGTDFDIAHDIMEQAIKAHLPNAALAKKIYKLKKSDPKMQKSEHEFIEDWKRDITDLATESFYAFFSIKKSAAAGKTDPEDAEPKVYGNMSAREYRLQRRHADSFPVLDTAELEKRMAAMMQNPLVEDLMNVLGNEDSNGKTE
jgi:hypothetical protein